MKIPSLLFLELGVSALATGYTVLVCRHVYAGSAFGADGLLTDSVTFLY